MTAASDGTFFIGGLYKSGTSLLRAMLGQHSRIATGLETFWFDVDIDARVARNGEPLDAWIERMSRFLEIPGQEIDDLVDASDSSLSFLSAFFARAAEAGGAQRWGEKTTENCLHFDAIARDWPAAPVINIIRDPKDVLASYMQDRHERVRAYADRFPEMWVKFVAGPHQEALADPRLKGRYLVVRYEDVVLNPETALRRITDFLGEPFEAQIARFDGKPDDFEKVREATGVSSTTLEQLRNPLHRNRIGIWHDTLNDRELTRLRDGVAGLGHAAFLDAIEQETADLVSAATADTGRDPHDG